MTSESPSAESAESLQARLGQIVLDRLNTGEWTVLGIAGNLAVLDIHEWLTRVFEIGTIDETVVVVMQRQKR